MVILWWLMNAVTSLSHWWPCCTHCHCSADGVGFLLEPSDGTLVVSAEGNQRRLGCLLQDSAETRGWDKSVGFEEGLKERKRGGITCVVREPIPGLQDRKEGRTDSFERAGDLSDGCK